MLTLFDRQMIRSYFKAYFVCLVSMLTLYIIVDLFTNLDDFVSKSKAGIGTAVRNIFLYYLFQIPKTFDRLCEAIVLLAAMFTVAWMQRNNEQMPLLSAGVSTGRIVRPVLISAFFMLSLAVLNQELLIPRIAARLNFEKDDPDGEKLLAVKHGYEPNGVFLTGDKALRKGRVVLEFKCVIPDKLAGGMLRLTAKEAVFHPNPGGGRGGKWEMTGTTPAEIDGTVNPTILEVIDTGRYSLNAREVDFDALTRNPNWFTLVSTTRLYQELEKSESNRQTQLAVLFHVRLTRPLLGMVLVLLGLAVILRDQNRNVILSAGSCLVLCAIFFAACYSCKMLGEANLLSAPLSAWLPVLFFGPLALVLFDAVHT